MRVSGRCALCLLKEDPAELLRRLAIICLEDAILHPGLPLVVWCMAAQSKVSASKPSAAQQAPRCSWLQCCHAPCDAEQTEVCL